MANRLTLNVEKEIIETRSSTVETVVSEETETVPEEAYMNERRVKSSSGDIGSRSIHTITSCFTCSASTCTLCAEINA